VDSEPCPITIVGATTSYKANAGWLRASSARDPERSRQAHCSDRPPRQRPRGRRGAAHAATGMHGA